MQLDCSVIRVKINNLFIINYVFSNNFLFYWLDICIDYIFDPDPRKFAFCRNIWFCHYDIAESLPVPV